MGKIKFVSNEGNFTAKGYVLNEVYETGPRTESGKNPGKFYYHVTGKNIAVAGLNEWETNLFLYFKFPSNSEEANQANAYLAILKGTPSPMAPVVPVAQIPVAPVVQTGTQQVVQPTAPAAHVSIATTPASVYIGSVQEEKVVAKTSNRDILLAGLTNLDFQSLNLKFLKIEGKIALTVILDGLPPLTISSGDISAASIVEQIVSTFSESAQIVSTIREWRKGLSELQAELAKESVETKIKVDAKRTRVAKAKEVPVVETAIPNELPSVEEPVSEEFHKVEEFPDKVAIEEPVEELKPSADLGSPVYMDDSLDMPPVNVNIPEEEEPVAEGNGLDSEIDEFQLK